MCVGDIVATLGGVRKFVMRTQRDKYLQRAQEKPTAKNMLNNTHDERRANIPGVVPVQPDLEKLTL